METIFGDNIVENRQVWEGFNGRIFDIMKLPIDKQTQMLKFLNKAIDSNKSGETIV
jgi:RNA binding exosome subunit